GPTVMAGYHRRPDENRTRRLDGWHRTHDLGRRHHDGSVTFIGPMSRLIKSGGENVYPAEVEAALIRHSGIAAAAVIGTPDDTWGQSVKAVVVRASGSVVDASE